MGDFSIAGSFNKLLLKKQYYYNNYYKKTHKYKPLKLDYVSLSKNNASAYFDFPHTVISRAHLNTQVFKYSPLTVTMHIACTSHAHPMHMQEKPGCTCTVCADPVYDKIYSTRIVRKTQQRAETQSLFQASQYDCGVMTV